jgi:hypothetical protein
MGTAAKTSKPTAVREDELCKRAGIPIDRRDRFIRGVDACVASYRRSKCSKSLQDVEAELMQISVRRCVGLHHHKSWRPTQFRKQLEATSAALRSLSRQAKEYLQFRDVKLTLVIPEGWPPLISCDAVIDPICFPCRDGQVDALHMLSEALSGLVATKRERGRPQVYAERALYHCLAVAFTRDTAMAVSDRSTRFMAVCDDIKAAFELNDWKPESLARSVRKRRATEFANEQLAVG